MTRARVTEQGSDDVRVDLSADELVAMVHRLTEDAWAMSGREMPVYERAEAPGRLVRLT